jgi:DNA-binding response OmpR family regulator
LLATDVELSSDNSAKDFAGAHIAARSKPRLLVVDDNVDNRVILARLFQRRNFDVVEADCGQKALDLVGGARFDTILLDINMPDMSGLEVLRTIRSGHSPDSLPVIMVTGQTQNSDIVEALEMGANDFVAKPVAFAVALARVNLQVERRRAAEALASANAALSEANERLERRVFERMARLAEANERLENEMAAKRPQVRGQRRPGGANDRPVEETIAQRRLRSRRLRARSRRRASA